MPIHPALPDPMSHDARTAHKLAELERRLATIERSFQGGAASALPVVDALPPAGKPGRVLVLASDGKAYLDDGASWNPQT